MPTVAKPQDLLEQDDRDWPDCQWQRESCDLYGRHRSNDFSMSDQSTGNTVVSSVALMSSEGLVSSSATGTSICSERSWIRRRCKHHRCWSPPAQSGSNLCFVQWFRRWSRLWPVSSSNHQRLLWFSFSPHSCKEKPPFSRRFSKWMV